MTQKMTNTILPPPDKHELEVEVSEQFRNGDIKQIARYVQRDSGLVSRMLSPNCENTNNVIYFFILFLWAFDCIRRELGDAVIAIILRERSKWLADAPKIYVSQTQATKDIGDELMEFIAVEMDGFDVDRQLKELCDIKQKIDIKHDLLIERRTREKFGFVNGKSPHLEARGVS